MKTLFYLITASALLILAVTVGSCESGNNGNQGIPPTPPMIDKVTMVIDGKTFTITILDTPAGRTFKELLPMTLAMDDVNRNEKFATLSENLPTNAVNPVNIRSGDLMLYGSNGLVLFYKSFPTSYRYTRIGTVDDPSGLEESVGSGSVTIIFN